jgi:hypothetical protein
MTKSLTLILLFVGLSVNLWGQTLKENQYNITLGGTLSKYLNDSKLKPMVLPALGFDLSRQYSHSFGLNVGLRYSLQGSKTDTYKLYSHNVDAFVAPRYQFRTNLFAELGLQFHNPLQQQRKQNDQPATVILNVFDPQLEIFTGLAYQASKQFGVHIRYTLPFKWLHHQKVFMGVSYKIAPRTKKSQFSFISLELALENYQKCTELVLHREGLEVLPREIGRLQQLRYLYLNGNMLKTLPPQISRLLMLKRLIARHNQLSHLPPEIGRLLQLEELDLGYNKLDSLPDEIGNLRSLRFLYLQHNNLETLPASIGNLRLLVELDVSHNAALMQLPVEINHLRYLEKLIIDRNTLLPVPFNPANPRLQVIVAD